MKSKLPKSTVKTANISPAQLSAQLKTHLKTFQAPPYRAGDRGVIESCIFKFGIHPNWRPHADAVKQILAAEILPQRALPAQIVADNGEFKSASVARFVHNLAGDNE
jgi:hypothetical protein